MAPVEEPLAGSLFRLANEYKRELSRQLDREPWVAEMRFRPPCIAVLHELDERGPVSQREISDILGLDPSDLVGVLDVLEDAGLIERRRDPNDRRRNAVVTTTRGRKASARLRDVASSAEDRVLANLGAEQRRQLASLIVRALGE